MDKEKLEVILVGLFCDGNLASKDNPLLLIKQMKKTVMKASKEIIKLEKKGKQ
jgi:hypothetical protein